MAVVKLEQRNLEVKLVTLAVITTVLKKEDGKIIAQDTVMAYYAATKFNQAFQYAPYKASRNYPDIKNRA